MAFKDSTEVIAPDMVLPISGRQYRIPPVDAATGIRLQAFTKIAARLEQGEQVSSDDVDALQLDDGAEKDLYRRVLGVAYDEMVSDCVDWETLKLAGSTAVVRAMADLESAEAFWNAGGKRGKAPKAPTDRKVSASSGRRASTGSSRAAKKAPGSRGPA